MICSLASVTGFLNSSSPNFCFYCIRFMCLCFPIEINRDNQLLSFSSIFGVFSLNLNAFNSVRAHFYPEHNTKPNPIGQHRIQSGALQQQLYGTCLEFMKKIVQVLVYRC
ncbi:hypothetical protein FGO68_gene13982 [Halteria grandinella]|uniref:Uncharacterized protein n=1 Tax=Halteria grandinella TaxID=5974 RepID=A0A8J8NA50_HALGN|nr:hypothetical protein FGO68_gene13982 [Halteria grandinella]